MAGLGKRGLGAGLRGLAWSLLPLAAWLTGTLKLAASIVEDIGAWAAHLVFSPAVWLGVAVAGFAGVLFVVSGFMLGRRRAVPTSAVRRRSRDSTSGGQFPARDRQRHREDGRDRGRLEEARDL